MSNIEVYKLELFGQDFSLTTKDGNKEELRKVADYYRKKIEELLKKFPNTPYLNIAVLAGLTVTDELYNLSKSKNTNFVFEEKKIDEILNEAIKQLEFSLTL
ncbi:MAG: hypothetical protein A2086_03105 [Spirochaetes bacterium GWD1_27_9]|nr:MAG: hypothetical protein A2Z98_18710 [Spirochaetes bacterium GWB1_27_13]OHD23017.1 MAG: hypothetical protein A2Y34_00150 [Spirochaetes bacterium GWC1_27_15]OHD39612.1 MAG: hypothetical protein A2086_03105 [Spirochaetes bacterium GWD1_27_9]